jgi:hypothetical protein
MTQEQYWNTDAWHFNDKEWLTARKQEWKHVQKNLKLIARTEFKDSNYLKAHKEFFFKGSVSDDLIKWSGDREFGYILPFFVIWYHPSITKQELDNLMAMGCRNVTKATSMARVREIWDKVWTPKVDRYSPNYGFCGGKEKLIAEVFWGKPLVGAEFDQYEWLHSKRFPRNYEGHDESEKGSVGRTDLRFVHGSKPAKIFWGSVAERVALPSICRHCLGQYLFDHAMAYDCSDDDGLIKSVAYAATFVLHRHKLPKELLENEFAVQTLDELEALYRKKKFNASYQKVWEDVESRKLDIEIR